MLNGGIVKASAPWARDKSKVAIRGVFSGGKWSPEADLVVTQYRDYRKLGRWRVVGSGHLSGVATDRLLIVAPESDGAPFSANDVLVFGDGTYTTLSVSDAELPLRADGSVEVGPERYRGVALLNGSSELTRVLIFHERGAALPKGLTSVLWREKEYKADLLLPDSYIDDKLFAIGEQLKKFPTEWHLSSIDFLETQVEALKGLLNSGRRAVSKQTALRV
ncbi:MAG: hypothetical protein ACPGWR_17445 [Ardenticatenaceae bacterium]